MHLTRLFFAALSMASASAFAQVSVADFESGALPGGWTTTGSWIVSSTTGTSPNVSPAEGSFFARSGAPNQDESLTGTLSSPMLTVTFESLQWSAVGWSGPTGNGASRFEVLDADFSVKATVAAPLSDSWSLQSVNLIAAGLAPGSNFYFRAVDGNSGSGYAWLALDDLAFVGQPVPEPASLLLFAGGGILLVARLRRRRKGTADQTVRRQALLRPLTSMSSAQ